MQIGNAVPPMLAHAVGTSLSKYIAKKEFMEAVKDDNADK